MHGRMPGSGGRVFLKKKLHASTRLMVKLPELSVAENSEEYGSLDFVLLTPLVRGDQIL